MSDFNIEDDNTRLPLPAPRPDSDLDDKILAYARDNTPAREAHGPGRWVAGLATAGIVAVAVMITLPFQTPSTVVTDAEQYADPAPVSAAAAPAAMKSLRRERPADLSQESPMASARMSSLAADIASGEADSTGAAQMAGAGAGESEQRPSPEDLAKELNRLSDMLAAGEHEQAHEAYRQFRKNCSHCQLPATLEEALLSDRAERQPMMEGKPQRPEVP